MQQTTCQVCIMDTTDPEIVFHGADGCNHCINARARIEHDAFPGTEGEARLAALAETIKAAGRGREYDCLVGISGGVDSSYVIYKAKQLGLRPLALHLDNGWNSELAVHNIERLMTKLGIDLVTHVVDWEEIRDMQRACFNVPLMDIEIVSDHAIFAAMFKTAAQHGIKYILSGSNVATESIMPRAWFYDKRDSRHVRAVHRKFGAGVRLKTFPFLSPWKFLQYVFVNKIRMIPMLNYGGFNKPMAVEFLGREFDWRPYPNKHGESTFTRFFQDYYLPAKFGIDKRRAHFSSMIAAGQMTRDEAISRLSTPLFTPEALAIEKEYVLKKLGYTSPEWDAIMARPATPHQALPHNGWMFNTNNPLVQFIRRTTKMERGARGGRA
ncbi:MAG: N-acetyl sugar amidotransferase [Rickettsiales bacterium]